MVQRYEAHLVAQGYSQRPGIDYDETFPLVVCFKSIRCVIALATHKNMEVHQVDIKTAFLNGELMEEAFMCHPEGFKQQGKEEFVCRLNTSIYGLKQSPCCWNESLHGHLKQIKFVQTSGDPCIYVSQDGNAIVGVYVDDLLIAGKNVKRLDEIKSSIADCFEVKDMGSYSSFLESRSFLTAKDEQSGLDNQPMLTVPSNSSTRNAKPRKTPLDPSHKLLKGDES